MESGGVGGELPVGRGLVVCVIFLKGDFVDFSPLTLLSSVLYFGGTAKLKVDNIISKYSIFSEGKR